MKWIGTFIFGLIMINLNFSQVIFKNPHSQRVANYNIRAELDTRNNSVHGKLSLLWTNSSRTPARELQFHLYMNAFRNPGSTFLSGQPLRHGKITDQAYGGIDIIQMKVEKGPDLTDRIEFIQPDDGNAADSTVIRVDFPESVLPGQKIKLEMEFECRLPQIIARTGYVHDFYMLGQWFPKIGVFQGDRWNCHQFFPNSEFFADFGTYEVEITLPGNFVTGATGVLLGKEIRDTLQVLQYRAEDVHDFAFTAWPEYRKEIRRVDDIEVTLLYSPEHAGQVLRYFKALTHAIHYLNEWLMLYPYPNLTVVDVPLFAFNAGGMEYPCFIVGLSVWGFPTEYLTFPEEVIVHEYAHQYFYGLLASDEAEEPWMDEGFTSFATHKILNDAHGLHRARSTLFHVEKGQYDHYKEKYLTHPDADRIVNSSWRYEKGTYGVCTYDKPVMVLQTLENLLGKEEMDSLMKTYVQRWKFRHPRTIDFVAVVNECSDNQWIGFLEQALYTERTIDFKAEWNSEDPDASPPGLFEGDRVVIRREGEFILPVEIRCVFADGDTMVQLWQGDDSLYRLPVPPERKLVSVEADPTQKIWIDLNWTNNSLTLRDEPHTFRRHWLQTLKLLQQVLSVSLIF